MKRRLAFLVVTLGAVTLALVGVLRDVSTSRALSPLPVQPFEPDSVLLLSTTQLGAAYKQIATTPTAFGVRGGQGQSYTSGTDGAADIDTADAGVVQGGFCTVMDLECDGLTDVVSDATSTSKVNCPPDADDVNEPYSVVSSDLVATNNLWMLGAWAPYPMNARVYGDINTIWLSGGPGKVTLTTSLGLHIVGMVLPWSDEVSLTTVGLGGEPRKSTQMICQDTPSGGQSTYGVTVQTPPLVSNAAFQGDSGAPCATCADKQVHGFWADPVSSGSPADITVVARVLNNGPAVGSFRDVWEVETPTGVSATWDPLDKPPGATISGNVLTFDEDNLAVGVTTEYSGGLTLTCDSAGDYVVSLKHVAYPKTGTKDGDLTTNVALTAVRMKCPAEANEVDKQVILLDSDLTAVTGTNLNRPTLPQTGGHVQLLVGETATVRVGALQRNQPGMDATAPFPTVTGKEWFVAEAPDVNVTPGYDVELNWSTTVTVEKEGGGAPSATGVACVNVPKEGGGTMCAGLTFSIAEPPGPQLRVKADLSIKCTAAGQYLVPLKVIDVPTGAYGDYNINNNARWAAIQVYCWDSALDKTDADDGIDDATGIYPRWSTHESAKDIRKPGSVARDSSLPSDTSYVERAILMTCWWEDEDGTPTGADGYVSEAENLADDDRPTGAGSLGIDNDGDCLADAALAQPGHPVDLDDEPNGVLCDPPIHYNTGVGPFSEVAYDTAADMDCDGLKDGLEKAWGSNPMSADTDGDGATDFQEMFMFTDPTKPDTDGDGFKDKPSSAWLDNTNPTMDNCPLVYNPDQVNSDGQPRPAGPTIGIASNPTQDRLGDACDADDDNDGAIDVAELQAPATDPLNIDTDGDRVNDNAELMLGTDPTNGSQKPLWSSQALANQTYYRGCHINVPTQGTWPDWNDEYDLAEDSAENDPDGDGLKCNVGLGDSDSDNGMYTYAGAKDEILDEFEAFGYNTSIANKDTDGDGCEDWVEICDLNGDRAVNSGDILLIALRIAKIAPFNDPQNPISETVFDVNKDKQVNSGDFLLMALNTCGFKPGIGGCPKCMAGN